MNVVEIFDSIEGEGKFAGELATFIRLAGCNLRCSYCDTLYAMKSGDGIEMTLTQILKQVEKNGNERVTITGGEPLIHSGVSLLIEELCNRGYKVNIETNGSVDISAYVGNPNVTITMDYKTPSSGEVEKMCLSNLSVLRESDVLKIVCKEDDFQHIKQLLCEHQMPCMVYLSPIYGEVELFKLVDVEKALRDNGVKNVKVQIQLHKIIWNPERRGV